MSTFLSAQNNAEKTVSNQTLRVGIGQMFVKGGQPELNLSHAIDQIQMAAQQQCDVVVLPECLDFGWTHSSALTHAHPIPGVFCARLQKAAENQNIHVVAGLTERDGDKVYNTAVVISARGKLLAKHRKINILDIAQHIYHPGNSCQVVETELGTIGVNICADNSPASNQLGHALGIMGADIILSPCSWAVPPDFDHEKTPYGDIWKKSYTEIASKYQIPVVGVSNTGEVLDGAWKGWYCIGASLVVNRHGKIQKQFDFTKTGSKLYVIEIEL